MGGLETASAAGASSSADAFTFHFGWIRNVRTIKTFVQAFLFTFHFGWIRNAGRDEQKTRMFAGLHSILGGLETVLLSFDFNLNN